MPQEKLTNEVQIVYEGDDPPFHIRGPYSLRTFEVRKNKPFTTCEADADVLASLPGFRKL